MYNLCIVKKATLEISGSHREEIGEGGGLGGIAPQKPQNFKESKLPKGLSAICEKDIDMDLGKDQTYTSIWCWWW